MGHFKKLIVWKEARELSLEIYRITLNDSFRRDSGLIDQMRRAAVSVPSNIAEGEESGFKKLTLRYFHNAKASLAELETQVDLAAGVKYINPQEENALNEMIDCLSRKLQKLIQHRSKQQ